MICSKASSGFEGVQVSASGRQNDSLLVGAVGSVAGRHADEVRVLRGVTRRAEPQPRTLGRRRRCSRVAIQPCILSSVGQGLTRRPTHSWEVIAALSALSAIVGAALTTSRSLAVAGTVAL